MKCLNCGYEFGEGSRCPQCGTDRVSAGAEYIGYEKSNSGKAVFPAETSYTASVTQTTTICPFCQEIIPSNANFCPSCAKPLFVECPKCGSKYPSRYPVCPTCGTNREAYYIEEQRLAQEKEQQIKQKQQEEERLRKNEQDKVNHYISVTSNVYNYEKNARENAYEQSDLVIIFFFALLIGGAIAIINQCGGFDNMIDNYGLFSVIFYGIMYFVLIGGVIAGLIPENHFSSQKFYNELSERIQYGRYNNEDEMRIIKIILQKQLVQSDTDDMLKTACLQAYETAFPYAPKLSFK